MYFTIGAIFKNESHILKEWIDHYFFHGVEHIYLINDNSTDNFLEILKPYIDKKEVTLYNCDEKRQWVGMQDAKYNFYFQKHLKDTMWFGIVDLDEFLYSPSDINIQNILKKYENENQLHVNWVHFGSSGHIKQPELVVPNFLLRGEYNSKKNGPGGRYNSYKSIIKTNGNIKLGIHKHFYNNNSDGKNISFDEKNTPLLINHYAIQSKDFWCNVKMTRGDVNYWYDKQGWDRNMKLFEDMDVNDIEDNRLNVQNSYKDITILITTHYTSKQKLCLETLLLSIKKYLSSNIKILICCDSYNKNNIRKAEKNLNELNKIYNFEWYFNNRTFTYNNVKYTDFKSWCCNIINLILKCETKYFLFFEHDWCFLKNVNIFQIINLFNLHSNINFIRFSMRNFLGIWDTKTKYINEYDLTETNGFCNHPYVSRKYYWINKLISILIDNKIGEIEDVITSLLKKDELFCRNIGLYLYKKIGNESIYIKHLDGSNTFSGNHYKHCSTNEIQKLMNNIKN